MTQLLKKFISDRRFKILKYIFFLNLERHCRETLIPDSESKGKMHPRNILQRLFNGQQTKNTFISAPAKTLSGLNSKVP